MKMWIVLGITILGLSLAAGIIKIAGNRSAKTASSGDSALPQSPVSVSPAPSEIKSSAKVLKTEGEVNLTRNSQQSKINVDDILYEKDIIQTSAKSSAIIVFLANDSTVRLDENTKIEISLYTGDGQDTKINLDQPFGKTWHRIKKLLGQNSSYEVNAPTVVASVRGTGFGVDADSKNATITVDDGKVNTKLVDRSGPEIKIIHEINVIKNEEAKIDSQTFQTVKDQVERGETPELKPKRIEKDKVEEWIKTSREEEKKIEPIIEKMEIEKRNLESGISPAKQNPASQENIESRIMNLESGNKGQELEKPDRVPPERIIQGAAETKIELRPTEPARTPTKEEEKKAEDGERKVESGERKVESGKEEDKEEKKEEKREAEKQPESIIEKIKDFIEGKSDDEKSKSHLDVGR
jgi:hypothetical protein